jgi:hypothetical protein
VSKESEDASGQRVLELWQELVGFELGEVRRRAFLRRPEVRWLGAHPNGRLESAARIAMAMHADGHLLLAEWVDTLSKGR